jgi:hypothetical protein
MMVMAGYSRSKNGVLSHAYVPAIPLRDATSAGMTDANRGT